jgi:uncharacterized membrane protein YgcG
MGYQWLATAALLLHFGYIAFLGLGGFLAWKWPKAIWAHLVAVAWGLLIVSGTVNCPLTWVEDWARSRAGLTKLTQGFVDRYLDNVIYPAQYVNVARLGLALVIAVSYLGAFLLWRARRASGGSGASGGSAGGGTNGGSRGSGGGDTGSKSADPEERAATV